MKTVQTAFYIKELFETEKIIFIDDTINKLIIALIPGKNIVSTGKTAQEAQFNLAINYNSYRMSLIAG